MTRAAAFGVRPISARNRLVRWRPLQPVPGGRQAALPVAGVPGHVTAQRLPRYVAAMLVHDALVRRPFGYRRN